MMVALLRSVVFCAARKATSRQPSLARQMNTALQRTSLNPVFSCTANASSAQWHMVVEQTNTAAEHGCVQTNWVKTYGRL